MRCTIIYPNVKEARDSIFAQLIGWSKQVDLTKQEINAAHFKIVKDFPPVEALATFPTNLQAEEVIIIDDKIHSIRKFVVDVEAARVDDNVVEAEVLVENNNSQPKELENHVASDSSHV